RQQRLDHREGGTQPLTAAGSCWASLDDTQKLNRLRGPHGKGAYCSARCATCIQPLLLQEHASEMINLSHPGRK
ncbi:hypothetical protein P7K49_004401, partial [Saguinus oedipus]